MQRAQSEYEAIDIDRNPRPNPWQQGLPVATVSADGAFMVTFLDRELVRKGKPVLQGLAPVAFTSEMGIQVTMYARASGTVLYEDLCKGKIAGIEASPKHWQLWQRVCELRAQGKEPRRGALEQAAGKLGLSKIYHPEVYKRRSLVAEGGMFSADVDEILSFLGLEGGAEVDDLFEDEAPAKRGKR